jgi:hypothetical protein
VLTRCYGLYYLQPFAQASLARSENKKALLLSQQDFFFVADSDEISNLNLIKDVDKIVKLLEVLNI